MENLRLALLLCAPLCACAPGVERGTPRHSDGGVGDGGSTVSLTVSPSSASLTTGQTQLFKALANGVDVTTKAAFTVSTPSLGSFSSPGTFVAGSGIGTVAASYNGAQGSAAVTVLYTAQVIDPSAPAGAAAAFPGTPSTDPTETPVVAYPLSGALLARNITGINLQWTRAAKDTLFRLHFVGPSADMSYYVGGALCPSKNQCSFTPKPADWQSLTVAAAGSSVTMTIEGTAGIGQPVAATMPMPLTISPEDVKGGVYYFNPDTTQRNGSILRVPFGASSASPFISNGNAYGCVGCHAVSRDGKKVFGEFGGGDGYAGMVDGSNGSSYLIKPDTSQTTFTGNFATFSPDGTKILTNWAGKLVLRDGTTGVFMQNVPSSLYPGYHGAAMPEWSPDGNSIVFVAIPMEGQLGNDFAGDWDLIQAGSIAVMPYNNGAFGMAQTVVPSVMDNTYNFYPSWSPDSQWIVFATSDYPGMSNSVMENGTSYDQSHARLRLVRATGGAPIELSAATYAPDHTSTWPKFAPFIQQNGNLVFVTFNARFAYGFVVADNSLPQLWMTAIDLGKAASGSGDPSYAPFWLPFQDPTAHNHSATWTEQVACTSDGDCGAEFTCQNGSCMSSTIQ